jgi:hypothetical protein
MTQAKRGRPASGGPIVVARSTYGQVVVWSDDVVLSGDPDLMELVRLAARAQAVSIVDGNLVTASLASPEGAASAMLAAWRGKVSIMEGPGHV